MKTAAAIARFVLGLVFVVFGLNRALLSPLFERRFDAVERAESPVSPRNSLARPA